MVSTTSRWYLSGGGGGGGGGEECVYVTHTHTHTHTQARDHFEAMDLVGQTVKK